MSHRIKMLSDEARKLPPADRALLAEDILHSLDHTDPELDRVWANEAKDRLAAYHRGEIGAQDFDDVLARYDRE